MGKIQYTPLYEWIKVSPGGSSGTYNIHLMAPHKQHGSTTRGKFTYQREYKLTLEHSTRSFELRQGKPGTKSKPVVIKLSSPRKASTATRTMSLAANPDHNLMGGNGPTTDNLLLSLCLTLLAERLIMCSRLFKAIQASG